MRLVKAASIAVAAVLATGLAMAAPEGAAMAIPEEGPATGKNGYIENGEFGLYLFSDSKGTVLDLYFSDSDFSNDVFPGTSIRADDNTMSYRSRDGFWWHVYTGKNYTGAHGCIPPYTKSNASSRFSNKISSATFRSSGC